jgi:hypothetical protein
MPVYHNWGFPRLGSRTGQNVYNDLMGVRSRLAVVTYGVSLNATSTDVAVVPINVVPGGYTGTQNYIVRGFTITNASASLATSPTISLFTSAAGGGSNLITAASASGLTASNLFLDFTLSATATSTILTNTTLYIRTGASNAVAATADFYLYVEVLP